MTSRPILFGLDVPTRIGEVSDPAEAAREAERLGFDFVSVNDHLLGSGPRYEGWTLLAWLARATSRLRVASRVLGVPYRHPVQVAKMAETLDRLSNGRLILGLGAGSGEAEYVAMGLGAGGIRERVQGLEEAVALIRGLWTSSAFTHDGERYRVVDAELEPKPGHHIPVWLGAVGPRGLDLVGRSADGWIPSLGTVQPDRAAGMIARIRAAAAAAGRNADEIARVYNIEVSFTAPPEAELVSGPPAAVAERLIGFLRLGFTGFNFLVDGPDRNDQVARLAEEVIPAVRAGA
jgi:alkanesulfonate monooxygenase SsuD/methylene tetrahydromethanopterin reductase-like flavin-dependent oxidoreductase (luciferase family)